MGIFCAGNVGMREMRLDSVRRMPRFAHERPEMMCFVRKIGLMAHENHPSGQMDPVSPSAGVVDIAARTDSAADSKLFAQQMTQMARMDAVQTQVNHAGVWPGGAGMLREPHT